MISKSSLIGQFIENIESKYFFEKQLGAGSFGQVYRIIHKETNASYACKKINKKYYLFNNSFINVILSFFRLY